MSEDTYDYLFKIVIIGDSGVGKSNLLSRFTVRFNWLYKIHTKLYFRRTNLISNRKVQ